MKKVFIVKGKHVSGYVISDSISSAMSLVGSKGIVMRTEATNRLSVDFDKDVIVDNLDDFNEINLS